MKKHDDKKHSLRITLGPLSGEAHGWLAVLLLALIGVMVLL